MKPYQLGETSFLMVVVKDNPEGHRIMKAYLDEIKYRGAPFVVSDGVTRPAETAISIELFKTDLDILGDVHVPGWQVISRDVGTARCDSKNLPVPLDDPEVIEQAFVTAIEMRRKELAAQKTKTRVVN
jgi:hypothetical protein